MTEPTNEDEFDRLAREIGIPACPAILSQFSAEMHQPDAQQKEHAPAHRLDLPKATPDNSQKRANPRRKGQNSGGDSLSKAE